MTTAIIAATLSLTAAAGWGVPNDGEPAEQRTPHYGPYIEVWTSGEVFEQGDRAHVWFKSKEDAFVTVFRVNTDGRVRVLYPQRPWHNNFVPADHRLEVWSPSFEHARYAFTVNDYPGTGYIFAVASRVPFDYRLFVESDHWDYRNIGYYGRITGDPYVALMDMVDHIVPATAYDEYSYDIYPYQVGRRHDYPRFLCYDCHAYVAYPSWNPYLHSCAKFRIVVYDDPYYYPARAYAGTRVVYVRPRRVEARYVFRRWASGESFLTNVGARPVNPYGRRVASTRTTARDVGGVGAVPAPVRRPVTVEEGSRRKTIAELIPNGDGRRTARYAPSPSNGPKVRVQPRLERRQPPQKVEQKPTQQVPARRVNPGNAARAKADPKKVKPDSGGVVRRRGKTQ
jgi:hypothetical protein